MNTEERKQEDASVPLSRSEHIKEETRRALAFGQSPKKPLSLARRFRVEGVTRMEPPADVARGEELPVMQVAPMAAPRTGNPYAQLAEPASLLSEIDELLQRIDDGNRTQLTPRLLDLYGDFAAQVTDPAQLQALQQRVVGAAFGARYFTQSTGGSAEQQDAPTTLDPTAN